MRYTAMALAGVVLLSILPACGAGGGPGDAVECSTQKPCVTGYSCIQGHCIALAPTADLAGTEDLAVSPDVAHPVDGSAGVDLGVTTDLADSEVTTAADLVGDAPADGNTSGPDLQTDLQDIAADLGLDLAPASDLMLDVTADGGDSQVSDLSQALDTDSSNSADIADAAADQFQGPLDPFTGEWCGTLVDSGKSSTLVLKLGSTNVDPKGVANRLVAAGRLNSTGPDEQSETISPIMLALDPQQPAGSYRLLLAAFASLNGSKALIRIDASLQLGGDGAQDDSINGTWESHSRSGSVSFTHCSIYPGFFGAITLDTERYFRTDLYNLRIFHGQGTQTFDGTGFEVATTLPLSAVVVTVPEQGGKIFRLEPTVDLLTVSPVPEELLLSARVSGPPNQGSTYTFRGRDSNDSNISGVSGNDLNVSHSGSLPAPSEIVAVVTGTGLSISWMRPDAQFEQFNPPAAGFYRTQIRRVSDDAVMLSTVSNLQPLAYFDQAELSQLPDGDYAVDVFAVGVVTELGGEAHGIDFAVGDYSASATVTLQGGAVTVTSEVCPDLRKDATQRLAVNVTQITPYNEWNWYEMVVLGDTLYVGRDDGLYQSPIGPPWNFQPVSVPGLIKGNLFNDVIRLRVAGDRLIIGVNRGMDGQEDNVYVFDPVNGTTVAVGALTRRATVVAVDPADGTRALIGTDDGSLVELKRTSTNPETWTFTSKLSGFQAGWYISDIAFADPVIAGAGHPNVFYEWNSQTGLFDDATSLQVPIGGVIGGVVSWRPQSTNERLLIGVVDADQEFGVKGLIACGSPCRTPSAYLGNSAIIQGKRPWSRLLMRRLPGDRILVATDENLWVTADTADPTQLAFKLVVNAHPQCLFSSFNDAVVHGDQLYISIQYFGIVRVPLDQLQ